ncbi:putative 2-haloacid dehalogenase [Vibrio halioticoli NBRC 102217]|uniref:(S)-2-haloacid dehalogenase n=1 Tax=Vibrio halioticoli NBRC 102217 TaxID=1219072 RepID=V5HNI6_9VIBR|nr:haloacid dehalogenase type II [Vibrio halioticoli]GAD90795.1 putative 2-haloacid dehalogenase [Vibrio halioticoli NBRC 102217]
MNSEIILFDINETVLDLSSLKPGFITAFSQQDALSLWFSRLLHTSTVCIATGVRSDFATLAAITLDNVATYYKVTLSDKQRTELLKGFANLQAHSDIKPALSKLKQHGFKTVAFSNSSSALINQQIAQADLAEYFDEVVSVESTGSFKPDATVYQFVGQQLGVAKENLRLVATHDWDTHGAMSQGLKAAYIARTAAFYNPLYLKPEIQGDNMLEIVEQIISAYKPA